MRAHARAWVYTAGTKCRRLLATGTCKCKSYFEFLVSYAPAMNHHVRRVNTDQYVSTNSYWKLLIENTTGCNVNDVVSTMRAHFPFALFVKISSSVISIAGQKVGNFYMYQLLQGKIYNNKNRNITSCLYPSSSYSSSSHLSL